MTCRGWNRLRRGSVQMLPGNLDTLLAQVLLSWLPFLQCPPVSSLVRLLLRLLIRRRAWARLRSWGALKSTLLRLLKPLVCLTLTVWRA